MQIGLGNTGILLFEDMASNRRVSVFERLGNVSQCGSAQAQPREPLQASNRHALRQAFGWSVGGPASAAGHLPNRPATTPPSYLPLSFTLVPLQG